MEELILTKVEKIYDDAQSLVSVWKCFIESSGEFVALKEQGFRTVQLAEEALREYRIQRCLSHPNICRVISYIQEQREDATYNLVALEWMDKQDLYKEITNRKKDALAWKEDELWGYFQRIVSALAMAQRRGISHRDIKPQNLFINSRNEIKIRDFKSTKNTASAVTHTLVGTQYFLSPLLRAACIARNPALKVLHNHFKSDVFSLGVTFLSMAVLQTPIAMGSDMSEAAIMQAVHSISYSDTIKSLLEWMLAIEESRRPDFLELNAWLNPQEAAAPFLQGEQSNSASGRAIFRCPTCYIEFPFTSASWTASLEGYVKYCSIDCYLVMKDAYEHPCEGENLCLACREWSPDPWMFDCKLHGVCSRECGRTVIKNTTRLLRDSPKCPECQVPVVQMLSEMFYGEENYYMVKQYIESQSCERCKKPEADRIYCACGHVFCNGCYLNNILTTAGYFLCPHPSSCKAPYISKYE